MLITAPQDALPINIQLRHFRYTQINSDDFRYIQVQAENFRKIVSKEMSPELNDETVGVQTAFKCGSTSTVAGIPCKDLHLESICSRWDNSLSIAPLIIQDGPNFPP